MVLVKRLKEADDSLHASAAVAEIIVHLARLTVPDHAFLVYCNVETTCPANSRTPL